MKINTLERLIWVLIYGGLLIFVLGLAASGSQPALGSTISIIGGLIALLGFIGIYIRSRIGNNTKDSS